VQSLQESRLKSLQAETYSINASFFFFLLWIYFELSCESNVHLVMVL